MIITITYVTHSFKVKQKINDISRNYNCLIMGDSQVQRINPEFFGIKTYNLGCPAEHYYFTYSKLKKLLSVENSKIEVAVIGLSIHNFAPVYQKLFDLNYNEGTNSLKKFVYFFNLFEDEVFNFKNIIFQKDFIKGIVLGPVWGGLEESSKKNPNITDIRRIFEMHYNTDTEINFSIQEYYLAEIIKLCDQKNVEILSISTPVHEAYKNLIPDIYFENFVEIMNKNDKLKHINFFDDEISSEYMSDGNHLNKSGAAIYSKLISEEVVKLISSSTKNHTQ